jgi:arylsulfatase
MATCVEVSGANYPEVFHEGNPIHPIEGTSLLPAIDRQTIQRDALYWEHEGNRAVRVGDWKLVAKANRNMRVPNDEMSNWELYNMLEDRTEMHDLIDAKPDLARSLKLKWYDWAERCNVLPWPWSDKA